MDLLDELRRSEMLTVSVSGDYAVTPALMPAGSFRVTDRCVSKPPGLSWTLSPPDLGLPDLPVALEVRVEPAGEDAAGRPLVRLAVDQEIGVRLPGRRIVVERARGSLLVALSPPRAPAAQAPCAGGPRVAAVSLETVGEDSVIEVEGRASLLGLSRRATLRITVLRLEGTAWLPPPVTAGPRTPRPR